MINNNITVLEEEIKKVSSEKMSMDNAQTIAFCYMAKIALEKLLSEKEEKDILPQNKNATEKKYERNSTFSLVPTLDIFLKEHTEHNLKKVCLELKETCLSIYATLRNEQEKEIFKNAFKNLTTF